MAGTNGNVEMAISYANQVANILGLNNWQLYPGSYNGVKFHIIASGVLDNLNQLNPLAGTVSKISGFISRASQLGQVVGPQTNDNLPYGTTTVAKNVVDQGNRKYARHRIPNADYNILEDLGWDGEMVRVVGIIFGSSSYDANNNLFNVIINPLAALPQYRNVLVHPVLGTVNDVLLTSYKRIHSSENYKAIAYEFVFETSSPIQAKTKISSIASIIGQSFNAAVGIYNSLMSSIQLATTFFQSGKSAITSTFQKNYNNSLINAATFIGAAKLLYTNLKPPGFVSSSLESLNTSVVNLSVGSYGTPATQTPVISSNQVSPTPLTGYVSINLSQYNTVFNTGLVNGVSQVVALFASNVQETINTIVTSNQGMYFEKTIQGLEAALVSLDNIGKTLLNNILSSTTTVTTTTYTTLEEIMYQNGIDFTNASNIQNILSLNSGVIQSVNNISPQTRIILPNASS